MKQDWQSPVTSLMPRVAHLLLLLIRPHPVELLVKLPDTVSCLLDVSLSSADVLLDLLYTNI